MAKSNPKLPSLRLAKNQLVAEAPNPNSRTAPYFVRGRDPELGELTRLIHSLPNSLRAIVGPPGSGKSTLLSYLQHYAIRHGYDTVFLVQDDFCNPELLAKKIEPLLGRDRTDTSSARGEVNIPFLAAAGGEVETSVTETAVASIAEAVCSRATRAEKGLIILLDEFQNLADLLPTERQLAKSFIDFMHSRLPQLSGADGEQVSAICIAAGLLNVVDAAHEMGATRISDSDCLRMGPLSQSAAEQVIRDHLAVRGKSIPKLARARSEDIARIAATCDGYPHHITVAAWATQWAAVKARRAGRTTLTATMVDGIVRDARTERTRLYDSRWRSVKTRDEQYLSLVLTEIIAAWDNRLPEVISAKVEGRMARSAKENGEQVDTMASLRRLERAGIIERRTTSDRFPARIPGPNESSDRHHCMPILSFREYIADQRASIIERRTWTIEYDDLKDLEAAEVDRVPEWQWRQVADPENLEWLPATPPANSIIRQILRSINDQQRSQLPDPSPEE